jgi:hypothetical protein
MLQVEEECRMSSESQIPPPNSATTSCSVFLCNGEGQIIRDIGELLGAGKCIAGSALVEMFNSASLMAFLKTVRTHGIALEWEMKIHCGRFAGSLLLSGAQTPFGILVFANSSPHKAALRGARSFSAPGQDSGKKKVEPVNRPLTNAIHDLKNPIGSILSACEFMTEYSDNLNSEQKQMIYAIDAAAGTLLNLSDKIAQLSVNLVSPNTTD